MVEDAIVGPLVAVPGSPLLHILVPHIFAALAPHDALLFRKTVPPSLRLSKKSADSKKNKKKTKAKNEKDAGIQTCTQHEERK